MNVAWLTAASMILVAELASSTQCAAKLAEHPARAIILTMERSSDGLLVIVDEEGWTNLGFRSKQSLVNTLGCAMLGPGTQSDSIIVRGSSTNAIVGWQESGRLTVPLMFRR